MLNRRSIPHEVLNAKQHEREASIVAEAGRPGAVTVATIIHELMTRLNARFRQRRVSVSLPSLRIDGKLAELPALMTSVRKGGFTIAPEGGSEEFRKIIRKPILDKDLLATVKAAFKEGWNHVKMYFMIGFPMETDHDVDSIIDTARAVSRASREIRGSCCRGSAQGRCLCRGQSR